MASEFEGHKEAFLFEARAHLAVMNQSLLKLEKSPENNQFFHEIYRAVHTLKSMAAAMNFKQLASLSHAIEDLLEAEKKQKYFPQ